MNGRSPIWLTIAIAVTAFMAGLLIERYHLNTAPGTGDDPKVKAMLHLIAKEYVDTINPDLLMEKSIPLILRGLDPHTSYFDAQNSKITINKPDGVIPDIGIVFISINDTIYIECTVPDGPSDNAGLMPGDRIITVDGTPITNMNLNTGEVMKRMTGPDGSKLVLGVQRQGVEHPVNITVIRDRIRDHAIGTSYMLDKTTGYIKVTQFERNTYQEFVKALNQLRDEGAKRYMIDLRGNGGGYVDIAVLMANEFLSSGERIGSIHGRNKQSDRHYTSDGKGAFQNAEVAVLIDEYSASASEIFAGALQDNDRGLIVGRRSYGKGLVQKDFVLQDSSVLRLAVARYYTPSGRCIQKEYHGNNNYGLELIERYQRGEAYYNDSVKIDKSQRFSTRHGRTVYGGGGIVPDIFVARDLEGFTNYYIDVKNAGLLQRFTFSYCEKNRSSLNEMHDYKQFLRTTPIDNELIKEFASFAATQGIPPQWGAINRSRDVILTILKAQIARDIFGPVAYASIMNRTDKIVLSALKALNKHQAAVPITMNQE